MAKILTDVYGDLVRNDDKPSEIPPDRTIRFVTDSGDWIEVRFDDYGHDYVSIRGSAQIQVEPRVANDLRIRVKQA